MLIWFDGDVEDIKERGRKKKKKEEGGGGINSGWRNLTSRSLFF